MKLTTNSLSLDHPPSLIIKSIQSARVAATVLLPSSLLIGGNKNIESNKEDDVTYEWITAGKGFTRQKRYHHYRKYYHQPQEGRGMARILHRLKKKYKKSNELQCALLILMGKDVTQSKRKSGYSVKKIIQGYENSREWNETDPLLELEGGGDEYAKVYRELEDLLRQFEKPNENANIGRPTDASQSATLAASPSSSKENPGDSVLVMNSQKSCLQIRSDELLALSQAIYVKPHLWNSVTEQMKLSGFIHQKTKAATVKEVLRRFWLDVFDTHQDWHDYHPFIDSRLRIAMVAKLFDTMHTILGHDLKLWDGFRKRIGRFGLMLDLDKLKKLWKGLLNKYPIDLWDDLSLSEQEECWTGVVNSLVTTVYIKSKLDWEGTNSVLSTGFTEEELKELARKKAEIAAQTIVFSWNPTTMSLQQTDSLPLVPTLSKATLRAAAQDTTGVRTVKKAKMAIDVHQSAGQDSDTSLSSTSSHSYR